MATVHQFIYEGQPAELLFSDIVGEFSKLTFFDKGVNTVLEIEGFTFNEKRLTLTVSGLKWVYYSDGSLIMSPESFNVDATSQESIDYFANISTPKMSATVKRMQVNGVAIEKLGFPLFDSTGEFNPAYPES